MKEVFYQIVEPRCGCECSGEGHIILTVCMQCNSVMGSCSEIDFTAYIIHKGELQYALDSSNLYGCPSCGADNGSLRYATKSEISEVGLASRFKFCKYENGCRNL